MPRILTDFIPSAFCIFILSFCIFILYFLYFCFIFIFCMIIAVVSDVSDLFYICFMVLFVGCLENLDYLNKKKKTAPHIKALAH